MTQFQHFQLERMLCKWENTVSYDLSESGVHPVTLRQLLEESQVPVDELLNLELNYAQTNGIPALRERIADLYPGAGPDNVIVTVGCAEANYLAMHTVVASGDEIAVMMPNYMQIWGVAKNNSVKTRSFFLREELGWGLDIDSLNQAITPNTKMIAICNPNNPTGHILTSDEMDAIISAASRVNAWILADEVYSGVERHTDQQTPSFYGRYNKVLAMNSLSKAYGLPGLRIGWAVAPKETIEELWARHDYTTIGSTMLSNTLAEVALRPHVRQCLVGRARSLVRKGLPILSQWLDSFGDTFHMVPPQASPIAFARYHLDVNSTELADTIRREQSVLVVPGDHFGVDGYLRFRYGLPEDYLKEGLRRVGEIIQRYR